MLGNSNSLKEVAVLFLARVLLGCLFLIILTPGEKGGVLFTTKVTQLLLPIFLQVGWRPFITIMHWLFFFSGEETETIKWPVGLEVSPLFLKTRDFSDGLDHKNPMDPAIIDHRGK